MENFSHTITQSPYYGVHVDGDILSINFTTLFLPRVCTWGLTDMGNGIQFGGAIGYILLPGVAFLLRDFRLIQVVITAPEILFLIGWFFLPESPRWLLLNGRTSEAEEVIRSAAACNKLPVNSIKEQIQHLSDKFLTVSLHLIC